MTDKQLLQRLAELESDVKYQIEPADGEDEFRYDSGQIPILLSAPHGAVHTRNGKSKEEDEYTAGFARLVAELTGAHVLYARRKSATDPNYDDSAPYKVSLKEITKTHPIQFILDLHGMSADQKFGIAIGTMLGQSCPNHQSRLIQSLETSGFSQDHPELLLRYVVNHRKFTGGLTSKTVTRFSSSILKVPAAQVELNAYLRIPLRRGDASPADKDFRGNPDYIIQAIHTIKNLVFDMANQESV